MDNNPINDSFEHLEDADGLNVSEQLSASATTQTDKKVVKSTSTKTKTNNDKSILLVVVNNKKQEVSLKKLIKKVDPSAFIIVSDVHEVLGEGFKSIAA